MTSFLSFLYFITLKKLQYLKHLGTLATRHPAEPMLYAVNATALDPVSAFLSTSAIRIVDADRNVFKIQTATATVLALTINARILVPEFAD